QGRIYYGSFSRDGSRYAAVAETGGLRRWILISPEGEVLREGAPTRTSLSQLYLSPDGTTLTFESEGHGIVCVDLATGVEHPLRVRMDGTRYYSADGRTMLDLVPSPARLQLYDVSNAKKPVAVAKPLDTDDGHFVTGAVSADGKLVAVEMLELDDNPDRNLLRVVVFDRRLRQRAVLARRTTTMGRQFEGHYLFVGMTRYPIP